MRPPHLRVLALLLAVLAVPVGVAQADSTPAPVRTVTFRLHVAAPASPHTTYWVSYGPLAGKFGLIRLHATGNRYFAARRALPAGRTLFCYIAGTGTVRTSLGPAPGSPMITIARVGPSTAIQASAHVMTWRPPVG